MKRILLVISAIISLTMGVSITKRRKDKQPFTTEIFHDFKNEVLTLIQCDDGDQDGCPGLTKSHPDVTLYDRMSGSSTDKMLIPAVIRLAFHDCAEINKTYVVEGEKNQFQLPHKVGDAGGCNGCIDLNNPDNNNLLDSAILPLEPICEYYYTYISRADCWALAATIASEYSATLLAVTQAFPLFMNNDAAVQLDDIPYLYGRVDCESDEDPYHPYHKSSLHPLPQATRGWTHMSDFFKTKFGWDDNEFTDNYFTNKDIVGLISGAHSIGRAHEKVSGFSGQWDFTEDTIDNMFISKMFNQNYLNKNFGIGRPNFGPMCPVAVDPSYGTYTACSLPYDADTCNYNPSDCPLPDGHPRKLPNGECIGQNDHSRYYAIPPGIFGPSSFVCEWTGSGDENWNMSLVGNIGFPQMGVLQSDDMMSLIPVAMMMDPPFIQWNLALNTDFSLLWDISWYMENEKWFEIDCNSHAGSKCPDGSIVLTAPRSQNPLYTKFNIGKDGTELGEIYECPEGEVCCELIQCPVQCEGGINEFNRLIADNEIDTLTDDSDCPHALAYRYSMKDKRDVLVENRNMGIDYANAFKKMITVGYYDRKKEEFELNTVGDESDVGAANLVSMENGQLVWYSMLMIVGMVIVFGLCVLGYCIYQRKLKLAENMVQLANENLSNNALNNDGNDTTENGAHFANAQSDDFDNKNEDVVAMEI